MVGLEVIYIDFLETSSLKFRFPKINSIILKLACFYACSWLKSSILRNLPFNYRQSNKTFSRKTSYLCCFVVSNWFCWYCSSWFFSSRLMTSGLSQNWLKSSWESLLSIVPKCFFLWSFRANFP
nr:hypothetical protein [Gigaspora margarita]